MMQQINNTEHNTTNSQYCTGLMQMQFSSVSYAMKPTQVTCIAFGKPQFNVTISQYNLCVWWQCHSRVSHCCISLVN